MARARNIKPGLFKNEILGVADPLYTLLFEGLWLLADREGRLEDRPVRIKGELFPYRDGVDIAAMLTWLEGNGFIRRYQGDGKALIQIVAFRKHQAPHGTEKDSDLPDENGLFTVHVRGKNGYATGEFSLVNSPLTVKAPSDNPLTPDSGFLIPEKKAQAPVARKRAPRFDAKTMELPGWLAPAVWFEWCDDRRERGKPITERGAKKQLAQLLEFDRQGYSAESVVSHSIAGGFQGLYAPPRQSGRAAPTSTVPGPRGPDPALAKLDADKASTAPPPPHIRAQIDSVLRKAA